MSLSQPRLSLVTALAWIIGSVFVISGTGHLLLKHYWGFSHKQSLQEQDPTLRYQIRSILQTGPQKEALPTNYLAELMGLSIDKPVLSREFDIERAQKALLQSPVIKEAFVKILKPSTVYVDYTVRQPFCWLHDYENVALDEEGYLFPVYPFFSPKNLPAIYLGKDAEEFSSRSSADSYAAFFQATPLKGKRIELALSLLKLLKEPKYASLFQIRRIDVSQAFAPSYGHREIVLITEDRILEQEGQKERLFICPRLLRLSPKNYMQELGNYLELREKLLQEERIELRKISPELSVVKAPQKIIDFRIPQLAYIEEAPASCTMD